MKRHCDSESDEPLRQGLNGTQGLYSRINWAATSQFPREHEAAKARGQLEPPVHIGTSAPRASGGFTVYRHEHWCLEGTQLQYGDLFGETVPLLGCASLSPFIWMKLIGLPASRRDRWP